MRKKTFQKNIGIKEKYERLIEKYERLEKKVKKLEIQNMFEYMRWGLRK